MAMDMETRKIVPHKPMSFTCLSTRLEYTTASTVENDIINPVFMVNERCDA